MAKYLVVERNRNAYTVLNVFDREKDAKDHVERLKGKEDSQYFAEREFMVFSDGDGDKGD